MRSPLFYLRPEGGGQPSFGTIIVIGIVIAAYAIFPGPFHNGVRWATDAVFSSLAQATGGDNLNPLEKPTVPYQPRDPVARGDKPSTRKADTKRDKAPAKKKDSRTKTSTN